MMKSANKEVDEYASIHGTNKFELLLFRLGHNINTKEQSELFGINVLKVREIVTIPTITAIAGSSQYMLGIVHLRGQVIPVFDLPAIVGYSLDNGPTLLLITEYARTTQAFVVESVDEIVRLDWNRVISAEPTGVGRSLTTSVAQLDEEIDGKQLAQVLDVEAILQLVSPEEEQHKVSEEKVGHPLNVKPGTFILVADDSYVARALMEQTLQALHVPFEIVKSGQEAWDRLNEIADAAKAEGKTIYDKVCMMLTDLEMPEMDGFKLTRNIKGDPRMRSMPVVIHSSLTGSTNEQHVRSVGADGYVAKFAPGELAQIIRQVLEKTHRPD